MLRWGVRASSLHSPAEASSTVGKPRTGEPYVVCSRAVQALILEAPVEVFL